MPDKLFRRDPHANHPAQADQRILADLLAKLGVSLDKDDYAYDEEGNLIILRLGKIGLSELPPEIGQLTNLQWLYLGSNQLSELPPEIGQLTNLQWLSLGSNRLSELPPEIGQLTNLQLLSLGSNRLSELPPEIGQL